MKLIVGQLYGFLSLKVSLIVKGIDLIPTLLSLSTTRLPYHILDASLRQVCAYMSKFRTRLSAKNLVHLKRLVVFLDALKKTLIQWKEKKCKELSNANRSVERLEVLTPAELLDQMGRKAAGINLLEVEQYLKESRVRYRIPFVVVLLSSILDCT